MTPPTALRTPPGWLAWTIVLGGYLTVFGSGIINAIHLRGSDLPVTDLSTPRSQGLMVGWIGEVLLAVAALTLVAHYLGVSRTAAGLPQRRSSYELTRLTIFTAVGGLIAGGAVMTLLGGAAAGGTGGGMVNNGWAWPGHILRSVNAGVTEEIFVVAIPVLIGLSRGWSTTLIVAISAVLRWPYHLYHGWASLPWALIWGGSFAVAYLLWRRLLPLIAVHIAVDVLMGFKALNGPDTFEGVAMLAILAAAAGVGLAALVQRRNTRDSGAVRTWPSGVLRFLIRHAPAEYLVFPLIFAVAAGGLGVAFGIDGTRQFGIGIGLLAAGIFFTITALAGSAQVISLLVVNLVVERDTHGRILSVVQYRVTPDGHIRIKSTHGNKANTRDLILHLEPVGRTIVFGASPGSSVGKDLARIGYPPQRASLLRGYRTLVDPRTANFEHVQD